MPTKPAPHSYHWCQVALHWLVAVLVAAQYATGGSIGRTHDAVAHGLKAEPSDLILHAIHNRVGMVIFGLVLIRLVLRLLIGVPNPPGNAADWRSRCARAVHWGFYVILIAQASTGAIASYLFWPVGRVHVAFSNILLALIALHASAALWHVFVLRDGILNRMLALHGDRTAASLVANSRSVDRPIPVNRMNESAH